MSTINILLIYITIYHTMKQTIENFKVSADVKQYYSSSNIHHQTLTGP